MPNKVFISYRREDSRYQARRVYDAFVHALPPDTVFMDVDSIPPGADFVEILEGWVQQCDVLLALIGPNWLNSIDPRTGLRRVDSPDDFVRIEVRGALERRIPVVPVLLDATEMPTTAELPDDIKALRRRHAEFVDFRTFDADVQRLIKRLKMGRAVELPGEQPGARAADHGNRQATAPTLNTFLQRLKPKAQSANPLVLAAAAVLLLAIGGTSYLNSPERHVDASVSPADLAKLEESRRSAEARASEATDALAVAQKAREEAESKADAAATARSTAEENRRAAEARAKEATDALAVAQKAREEAEAKTTAAMTALDKMEEKRQATEAIANYGSEALKKSEKTRIDAENRANSAAAARAKAEEAQRTAEKAREAAETVANAAASAKAQADNSRMIAEKRANDTAEMLRKSEKAREEAETKLAALSSAPRQTAVASSLAAGHLLNAIGSKSRWAKWSDLYCNTLSLSLEVGSNSITWVSDLGKVQTEKILVSYENAFQTVKSDSQQTLVYSRDRNGISGQPNRLVVQSSNRDNYYLERCP